MNENGSETLSGMSLYGLADLLRDSNAIIKSTYPAGLFTLKVSIKSSPNILQSRASNSLSTPAIHHEKNNNNKNKNNSDDGESVK